jgi:hypothetical protein
MLEFSLIIQTDQRLSISDIEPQLQNLKELDIPGEVLIVSDKLLLKEERAFDINPFIHAVLVSVKSRSRATKLNHILKMTSGKIIVLLADDFEISISAIRAHINFHRNEESIKSVCIGLGWIKNKTIYNDWLENKGALFGYPFKQNAPYERMKVDFFYGGNASLKPEIFRLTGLLNESCDFDCTDDWLMWKALKDHGCDFFHLPNCDVEHIHDVTINQRFIAVIQSGWNMAKLNLAESVLDEDLDQKIKYLHRELYLTSRRLTNPKKLFTLIEKIGPQLGKMLFEEQVNLNDMYSAKKIYDHIFLKRNLPVPNLDLVDRSIRVSSPINFFRLYGISGLNHILNEFNKQLRNSEKSSSRENQIGL